MRAMLAVLAVLIVSGCVTGPETTLETHADRVRNELTRAVEERRPEDVIPRLAALRIDEILPSSELDAFGREAVAIVRSEYEQALSDERFDDAIRLHRNLVVLEDIEDDPAFLTQLTASRAREYYEEGNLPAALATFVRAPLLSVLGIDDIDLAAAVATELNNAYALGVLAAAQADWARANAELLDSASGPVGPVRMSEGVVTVWVDRGLKVVGGVGIPDRVVGSGFFIDPRGYIVTNYHVIQSEVDPEYLGYSRVFVRLPSDPVARIPARVVGHSRAFDVALLKIEVDAPYVFSFTDTRSLSPGTRIVAIGSPGGLENTITSGIISATGRRFLQMGDAMQVDVPINPGNSGGPLIDDDGRLVGVVFAGIQQFDGVNFAIPAYWVNTFLPQLYVEGAVEHAWMGSAVEPLAAGLQVSYVAAGSPADAAGLEPGDVITMLGGWEVNRVSGAQAILLQHEPGSLVAVTWERDGHEHRGIVALAARPENPVAVALDRDLRERLYPLLFGMQVERTGQMLFRPTYSVGRVYRGSIADETGITEGDTFTETGFEYDRTIDAVFLRMLISKRTQGFMRTNIQMPAYVERDNLL